MIGTAAERDLAIIRVRSTDLVPFRSGRSSKLRSATASSRRLPARARRADRDPGIVSGLDRTVQPRTVAEGCCRRTRRSIPATRAARSSTLGRLIGINTVAASRRARRTSASRSRSTRAARDRRDPQQAGRRAAWIGIAFDSVDSDSAAVQLGLYLSVRGAVVTVVYPGRAGADANLEVGDVITVADDVPIRSAAT